MARTAVVPTATIRLACIHGLDRLRRDDERFFVQVDVFQRFRAERLECAEPDVQRDVRDGGSRGSAGFEDFGREMQAGGGRGGGSGLAGEDGLVAFAVGECVVTANVGRQGHVTDSLEHGQQVPNGMQGAQCARRIRRGRGFRR